jgi:hypothetical protein
LNAKDAVDAKETLSGAVFLGVLGVEKKWQ